MATLFPAFSSPLSSGGDAARESEAPKKLNNSVLDGYRTELGTTDGRLTLTSSVPAIVQIWYIVIYLALAAYVLLLTQDIQFRLAALGVVSVHWLVTAARGYAQHKYYKRLEEADR